MKGFFRLYAVLSSVFTAGLLSSAVLLACLAWMAPEWLAAAGASLAGAVARASGANRPALDAGAREARGGPAGADATGGPELAGGLAGAITAGVAEEAAAATRTASWPEAEAAAPAALAAVNAALRRRLDAWESLREPLLRLLARGGPATPAAAGAGDIVRESPALAAGLEALTRAQEAKAGARLQARTVARLLLDGGAVTDAEARELLSRLDPAGAREVIERLSRASPARAGRLLRPAGPAAPARGPGEASVSPTPEEG